MKHKGILIAVVLLALLFSAYGFGTYYSFHHNGLNRALAGQVEEDRYPDWDNWNKSEKDSGLECEIVSKSGLRISKVYLVERANHYQVRFRIGGTMPFLYPDLLKDTKWILEDFAGSSYTGNMVVYAEQIAGVNCINVTLVLDEDEFSNLSGKELNFAAICSKEEYDKAGMENSYAHCEAKISFP